MGASDMVAFVERVVNKTLADYLHQRGKKRMQEHLLDRNRRAIQATLAVHSPTNGYGFRP